LRRYIAFPIAALIAALTALAALLVSTTQAHAATAHMPGPSWDSHGAWTISFDAGFNRSAIRKHRWNETWWVNPGSNGISWSANSYMTACYAASHDSEWGGNAHLLLSKTPNYCGEKRDYTGAILDTYGHFSQEAARNAFEARIYLPCNSRGEVYGWPAWWTLDSTWTGEIDDVEGGWPAAADGGTASHLEYGGANPGWQSGSPQCGWHDFGSEWNEAARTVTFYWNGRPEFTHSFPIGEGHPEYLILDYQMAANAIPPPAGGATMLVDWVRAWRSSPPSEVRAAKPDELPTTGAAARFLTAAVARFLIEGR
jgi:hypothetical protein